MMRKWPMPISKKSWIPDGYSTNLSQCVNIDKRKLFGIKTHDCDVFLERLLLLIMRDLLPKNAFDALTKF